MNKKNIIWVFILLIIPIITIAYWHQRLSPSPKHAGPLESLRASTVQEYSTLIHIAKHQNFFQDNGLDVTTVEYDSGGTSFEGLLKGEVDVATGADFVGVRNSFDDQDFKIITSQFDSSDVFELVGRKDHGILKPENLKGKKIGLTQKTMGEFFLGMFLTSHNLSLNDVIQVNGDPAELTENIMKGTIDAVVTFHPHINDIQKKLGNNSIKFMTQGNQLLYTLLYAKNSFIKEHPGTIERFVKALVQAEQFILDHPQEVKDFFAKNFGYTDEYTAHMMKQYNFRVSLRQAMLLAMEDQARWTIENKLTDKEKVPNYLDFIYFNALDQVKPDAISIFR